MLVTLFAIKQEGHKVLQAMFSTGNAPAELRLALPRLVPSCVEFYPASWLPGDHMLVRAMRS
jgi:hypothetical protein